MHYCIRDTSQLFAGCDVDRCGNYFVTRYKLKEEYTKPSSDRNTRQAVKSVANAADMKDDILEDDIDEHPMESMVPGMNRSVKMQRSKTSAFWDLVRGGS